MEPDLDIHTALEHNLFTGSGEQEKNETSVAGAMEACSTKQELILDQKLGTPDHNSVSNLELKKTDSALNKGTTSAT